jgi:glycosyltransferase involved in cell wall biosynthesis
MRIKLRVAIVGALPESLLNFRGDFLRKLVSEGYEVIAMSHDAKPNVIASLEKMGVSFISFPIQRNRASPFEDLKTFLALRKILQTLKPDVMMAYTIKPVIWGGLAVRGIQDVRFYALITGLGFAFQGEDGIRGYLVRLVVLLYRFALIRASGVIFQNPDNKNEFIKRKIVADKNCFIVNGSGVDLTRFAQSPLSNKQCIFLAIGRLLGDKGFREYAAAACLVKKRFPDVSFRLVGPADPSPDSIPIAEVQSWNEQGWIEFFGAIKDVRPFINDCSVFVLPSYHEGMPRTILEAMSVGRPILTTDVSGCRETVISGENGFLVPKADARALAERMIWFIENQDMLQKMGNKSRQLAEEHFDVRTVNDKLLSILGLKD